jgi:hypothetical protein
MLELYNKIKDQTKTGDGIAWHGHSLLGATIQGASGGMYQHASMILRMSEYEGEERRRYHTEATERGVFQNLLSKKLEAQFGEVYWYPLRDEWNVHRAEIGRRLIDMMGGGYDYSTLFKMAVYHPETQDDYDYICSEVLYRALGFTGKIPSPNELFCEGGDERYWCKDVWKPKERIL